MTTKPSSSFSRARCLNHPRETDDSNLSNSSKSHAGIDMSSFEASRRVKSIQVSRANLCDEMSDQNFHSTSRVSYNAKRILADCILPVIGPRRYWIARMNISPLLRDAQNIEIMYPPPSLHSDNRNCHLHGHVYAAFQLNHRC